MKRGRTVIIKCSRCLSVYELEGPLDKWGKTIECPNCCCVIRIKQSSKLRKGVLGFVGCLVFAAIGLSCVNLLGRKSAEANIVTTGQKMTAVSQMQRDEPEVLDFFASKNEVMVLEEFKQYRDALFRGDFDKATNHLGCVNELISEEEEKGARWARIEKLVGTLTILRIFRLCQGCKGNCSCRVCSGSGLCGNCRGKNVCPECKGVVAQMQKRCDMCGGTVVCQTCRGNGLCRGCTGYKTIKCDGCRGVGNNPGKTRVDCLSCRGRGVKPGLRRGDGSSIEMRCVVCGGKGWVQKDVLNRCSECFGKGRVGCQACNGDGRCASCNGTGKPKETCEQCSGTGKILVRCSMCSGSGKCKICGGGGVCAHCAGKKLCHDCNGSGFMQHAEMPLAQKWLEIASGSCWFDKKGDGVLVQIHKEDLADVSLPNRYVDLSSQLNSNEVVVVFVDFPKDPLSGVLKKVVK